MLAFEWLIELERAIEKGDQILGCPSVGEKQWAIQKPIDELRAVAKRVADAKKVPVHIYMMLTQNETMVGDVYLVPTRIENTPVQRGNPQIQWSIVETKEAAEMMRDVRFGPSPFYGIQEHEVVEPSENKQKIS